MLSCQHGDGPWLEFSQSLVIPYAKLAGIAMLFSAGTFLYVATVHVLPELTQNSAHSYSRVQSLEGGPKPHKGGLRYSELFILIIGCLIPLLLTFSHSH